MEGDFGTQTSKHEGEQSVRELKRKPLPWVVLIAPFILSMGLPIEGIFQLAVLYPSYLVIPEYIVVLPGFALVAAGHHILVFRWSFEHLRKYASISLVLILSGLLTVVAGSRIGFTIAESGGTPLFIYGILLGFIPFWYLFAYIRISGILSEKMECPSCGRMIPYEKGGDYIYCRFCGWTFDKISLRKLIEDSIR